MNDMAAWGLTERYITLASQYPDLTVGRIISQEKGLYRVVHENAEQNAVVSGRFRFETNRASDYPSVGDFVMLATDTGESNAVIHSVLDRKSAFIRKAAGTAIEEQVVASNVDICFICMSLNNDFNPRRLERYLSIAWESSATPVVVLTKLDLCDDAPQKAAVARSLAAYTDIIITSGFEKDGYRAIAPYVSYARTIAFIGSSGVGKSTLINRLIGEDKLATNGLRNDDKGRHTTTRRELILLPDGGIVLDTPGMREIGMWNASDGLERTFGEIEDIARKCKFHNCGHTNEPGCAVRAALEDGTISKDRYMSYIKLKKENARVEDDGNYLTAKEKKFKEISRINKARKRLM